LIKGQWIELGAQANHGQSADPVSIPDTSANPLDSLEPRWVGKKSRPVSRCPAKLGDQKRN